MCLLGLRRKFAVIVDALLADAEPANLYKRMSTWADP
jgi:hypothetical protein